jgi:hypothetical protein
MNELAVTSDNLHNFAGLVTNRLELDVARGPPVLPQF